MRGSAGAIAAALLLVTTAAPARSAPSFACDKARTRAEKAICANAELSALDEYLARYYGAARDVVGRAADCLAADQRGWLRTVRDACADANCLEKAYLARLAELDALQPGATALKRVALPAGPSLVWIVPAAQDEGAAPRRANPRSLEARGFVVDDLATGDGFVLRTAEGASYLLLLAMFVEPDSAARLTTLARERGTMFLARGHAGTSSGGTTHFEPSRCVFIYRLP